MRRSEQAREFIDELDSTGSIDSIAELVDFVCKAA